MGPHVEVRGQMWESFCVGPGIELRLLGLVVKAFACKAIHFTGLQKVRF